MESNRLTGENDKISNIQKQQQNEPLIKDKSAKKYLTPMKSIEQSAVNIVENTKLSSSRMSHNSSLLGGSNKSIDASDKQNRMDKKATVLAVQSGQIDAEMPDDNSPLDNYNTNSFFQAEAVNEQDHNEAVDQHNDINSKSVTDIMGLIGSKLPQALQKKLDDAAIPEALPLIRRISYLNSKEPDLYQKVRKGQPQNRNCADDVPQQNNCEHEEGVEDWKCVHCENNVSKFDIVFDDRQGKVSRFTRIVYENHFLSDFKQEFKQQAAVAETQDKDNQQVLLYKQYQPSNTIELKEYQFMIMCKKLKKQNKMAAGDQSKMSPFGSGEFKNLSGKLLKFLIAHEDRQKRLRGQYANRILLLDSIFESGNLLQAERNALSKDTYNLFMQVDTNTRGHQQWFYFRAKGGIKGKKYTFQIMNFTKPGVTGGRGYKNGEHDMRIFIRSKRQRMLNSDFEKWDSLSNCSYVKTGVARRKKDVIAAGADSDQEEWVEEAFQRNNTATIGKPNEQQLPNISLAGPDQQVAAKTVVTADGTVKPERPRRRRVFYYYALQFSYTFEHDDDTVYFAFAQPITLTDIFNDLHQREKMLTPKNNLNEKITNLKKQVQKSQSTKKLNEQRDEHNGHGLSNQDILRSNRFQKEIVIENHQRNIYYKRTEFCRSISGLPLQKVVIARDFKSSLKNRTVLITSRVHSGETPGSQVFRGIYNFLTSDNREAKYLRRFYTFILIPVMNPDGVVCGNYRNSLAGVDLNRQWINPEEDFHPEVCAVKKLMQTIKEEDKRHIWIFCDLHGHSKKNNSFFYGCNTAANGGFLSWTIVRLLPRIFAQKTHMFNYKDCRFRVEPYKIGTARIVAWKQFQITHSFTLENSFYGYDVGEDESRAFTEEDYQNVGLKFILSIYDMHTLWKQIKRELQITHGWLKPRTLNEMTGVPAAQIIAEEAAKQKEEERKRKAIQQYEEFLKKFYKEKKPIIRHYQAFKNKAQNQEEDHMPNKKTLSPAKQKDPPLPKLEDAQDLVDDPPEEKQLQTAPVKREAGQELDDAATKQEEEKGEPQQADTKITKAAFADEEQSEQEFMFKMHQGLVKIQALIRGYLARKLVKKKRSQAKKNTGILNKFITRQQSGNNSMKRQRSNQVLGNSSSKKIRFGRANAPSQMNLKAGGSGAGKSGGTGGFDTSSDGGMKGTAAGTTNINNPDRPWMDTSNDDQLMRSNTEQLPMKNLSDSSITKKSIESGGILGSVSMFGHLTKDKNKLEWRNFFDEEELDRAYQIVEVEQRDETDNDGSNESMGSNSDPSEDNLDEEEVYRNVYKVENPEALIEQKKQKEQEFIVKVQTDQQTQQDVLAQLHSEFQNMNEDQENKKSTHQDGHQKNNSNLRAQESQNLQNENSIGDKEDNQHQATQGDESIQATPFSNINKDLDMFSNHALVQKAQNQISVKQSPLNIHESRQDNLFQDMTSNARRMIKSSNQQRAFTQQVNNNLTRVNFNQHARLVQQTYKIQQNLNNKKQNINQVIKDCFIIKRMGSKNPGHATAKLKGLGSGQYMQMSNAANSQNFSNNLSITPNKYGSSSKKSNQHKVNLKVSQMQKQYQTHGVIVNNLADYQGQMLNYQNKMQELQYQQSLQKKHNMHGHEQNYNQLVQSQLHQMQQLKTSSKAGFHNRQQAATENKNNSILMQQLHLPSNTSAPGMQNNLSHNVSFQNIGQHSNKTQNASKAYILQKELMDANNQLVHSQNAQSISQIKQSQAHHHRRMVQGQDPAGQSALINGANPSQSLNEQQAQQLVNQLNACMKNMTHSQAIQFLKMIQDKNIYISQQPGIPQQPVMTIQPTIPVPTMPSQQYVPHQHQQQIPRKNMDRSSGNFNSSMNQGQMAGGGAQAANHIDLQNQQLQQMHFHPPLNIEIDPYKNFLGAQLPTSAAAQHNNNLSNHKANPNRKSLQGRSNDQSPSRSTMNTNLAGTSNFFNAQNNKSQGQIIHGQSEQSTQHRLMQQQYLSQDLHQQIGQELQNHRASKDRGQQPNDQLVQKNPRLLNPYFNHNNSSIGIGEGQVAQNGLGTSESYETQAVAAQQTGATRYYSSKEQRSDLSNAQFNLQEIEQLRRQGRNNNIAGQSNQHWARERQPPSAQRAIKTAASSGFQNHLNDDLTEFNGKIVIANDASGFGTSGLNRTFYNQQSSASKLHQTAQLEQYGPNTIHASLKKSNPNAMGSSIQQNAQNEYDVGVNGASLFMKYVKKKASLQQSTTYQNFPIKHVQQKQLSGHDVTATISSQISKQQHHQRPSHLSHAKSSQIPQHQNFGQAEHLSHGRSHADTRQAAHDSIVNERVSIITMSHPNQADQQNVHGVKLKPMELKKPSSKGQLLDSKEKVQLHLT